MKRWIGDEYAENRKVDDFLAEIFEVCKKHNMSISHEDDNGSFKIEKYDEDNIEWLNEANDNTELRQEEEE